MIVAKYVALRRQRITTLSGEVVVLEPGDELFENELHPIELARMIRFGWLKPKPKKTKGTA